MPTIGSSYRTPYKHWMLDVILGNIIGALPHLSWMHGPLHLIDLCAGDGQAADSSPQIFRKHASVHIERGYAAQLDCVEKDQSSFEQLRRMAQGFSWMHVHYQDATDWLWTQRHTRTQPVFLFVDPNHIQDIPFIPNLLHELAPSAIVLVTLGCNVGGMKRLPPDLRKEWFPRVNQFLLPMLPRQDALLITLTADRQQWAYLLRLPKVWSEKYATMAKNKSQTHFGKACQVTSKRRNTPAEWDTALDRLLLRRGERDDIDDTDDNPALFQYYRGAHGGESVPVAGC